MPTISRFHGITITMYFDDHGFPHFHARHAGKKAKVRIDTLEVMGSTLHRRELRLVLGWARAPPAPNWKKTGVEPELVKH